VYVATGCDELDERIARAAHEARVPVNVIDRAELCTFLSPAIVDRAPLLIAIGSGGASPVLSRMTRELVDRALPDRWGQLAELAGRYRRRAKELLPDPRERRKFWEQALRGTAARRVLEGDEIGATAALDEQLTLRARGRKGPVPGGRVSLVEIGSGDPDLVTLKAHRLLQEADTILFDHTVPREILELARRDSDRVDLGGLPTPSRASADTPAGLASALASWGVNVVRLRGGDLTVLDREAKYLSAMRIEYERVPGVPAGSLPAANQRSRRGPERPLASGPSAKRLH